MTAPVIMRRKYEFSSMFAQGCEKCGKSMIAVCVNNIILMFFEITVNLRSKIVCISRGKRPEPYYLYSVYCLSFIQSSCGVRCYNLNIMSCFNQPLANFLDVSFHSTYIRKVTGTDLGYFQG